MAPLLLTLLFAGAAQAQTAEATPKEPEATVTASKTGEILVDPWQEDLGLEMSELATACGIGGCAVVCNLPLTVLSLGLWGGVAVPAAIGVAVAFLNNGMTRWQSMVMWPVVGAVVVGGAWTVTSLMAWTLVAGWMALATDANTNANLGFPRQSSNTALAVIIPVNVAFVVATMLTPAIATGGAIAAYNVTAELGEEGAPTQWWPDLPADQAPASAEDAPAQTASPRSDAATSPSAPPKAKTPPNEAPRRKSRSFSGGPQSGPQRY